MSAGVIPLNHAFDFHQGHPLASFGTDPDINNLLNLLAFDGELLSVVGVSLHGLGKPPLWLGCRGLDGRLADDLLCRLDNEVTFGRRRRGEHEAIELPLIGADGVARLSAQAFPLYRDTVALLTLSPPSATPLPWVEAYLHLWWRCRGEGRWNEGFRSTLDLLELGVVLLDTEGSVRFVNRSAERLLSVGDGVRRLGDMLSAATFEEAVRLQTAVGLAIRAGRTNSPVPRLTFRRSKGRPLVAIVAAAKVGHPAWACDPGVVIYLLDPDSDLEPLLGPVCDSHGLTGAEAQLARAIVAGATLAEAAAAQRIRLDTARSYLKQIFAKTGTHRQAELVRMMLSSILRAGPDATLHA